MTPEIPETYDGTGELPDALAFLPPSRTRAYLALEAADEPLSALELTDRLEAGQATAYRCLNALEDCEIVTTTHIRPNGHMTTAYRIADRFQPTTGFARTDGGTPAESNE